MSQDKINNWLSLIDIILNGILFVWIGNVIQKTILNSRYLKEYFIDEIKIIKKDYSDFLSEISESSIYTSTIIPRHKFLSIRLVNIEEDIKTKYKLEKDYFYAYHVQLLEIITESEIFIKQFKKKNKFEINEELKISIIKFQSVNERLFNNIIIQINDLDKPLWRKKHISINLKKMIK